MVTTQIRIDIDGICRQRMWVYALGICTLLIQRYGDLARWKWRAKRNKSPSSKFSILSLLHINSDETTPTLLVQDPTATLGKKKEHSADADADGIENDMGEREEKKEKTTELVLFSFPKKYSESSFGDCVKVNSFIVWLTGM